MLCGLSTLPDPARVVGWPYYSGGELAGPDLQTIDGQSAIVHQRSNLADALDSIPALYETLVYRRGAFYSLVMPNDSLPIIPQSYEVVDLAIAPAAGADIGSWSATALFAARPLGDRIRLEWTDRPDESDFRAYLIYWDTGLGGDPDTLLVTIEARDEMEWTTDALETGTYQFRLAYSDMAGNIDEAETPVAEATITNPPSSSSIDTESYSSTTRIETVEFDGTDEIWVYANFIPGVGMVDYVYTASPFAIKRAGDATWASGELWEGDWEFWFIARDEYGSASAPEKLSFRLVKIGGVLYRVASFGNATLPEADVRAAAVIRLTWTFAGAKPATTYTEVWVDDGEGYDLLTTVAAAIITYDHSASDGITYGYKVRSKYVSGGVTAYGDWSGETSAVADGIGPDGDHAIMAEVV